MNKWLGDELKPRATNVTDFWFDFSIGEIETDENGIQTELLFAPTKRGRATITTSIDRKLLNGIRAELHRLLDVEMDRIERAMLDGYR